MEVEGLGKKIKSPIVPILSHWEDDVITQEEAMGRAALLENMESYPLYRTNGAYLLFVITEMSLRHTERSQDTIANTNILYTAKYLLGAKFFITCLLSPFSPFLFSSRGDQLVIIILILQKDQDTEYYVTWLRS